MQQKGIALNAEKKPTPTKVNSRSLQSSSQRSSNSPKIAVRRNSRSGGKKQAQKKPEIKSPVIKKPKIEEGKLRKRLSKQVEEDEEDGQRVKKPALGQKKAKLRQQTSSDQGDSIEGNLKNLNQVAEQISQIAKRKLEECKVVSYKKNDSDKLVYVAQSENGNIYDCSKEELIKHNPCALVDFLEKPFKEDKKLPLDILTILADKIVNS